MSIPVNAWYNFWMHTRMIMMHARVHAIMTLKYLRMRQAYENAMMHLWLCFALVMLILIPHVECILFWIYNSCKLVKISSNAMIAQKVHWIWANSLIIHEIVYIQRISLILIFLTIVYLPFAKSEVSLTTLCWECIIYQVKS